MVKGKIILLLFLFITSCSAKPIYYKYKEITLTRIDKNSETYLFYGKCTGNCHNHKPFVKIEYPGFSNSLDVFIIFNSDKSISIVPVMGYCTLSDDNQKELRMEDYDLLRLDTLIKNKKYDFDGIARLSDNIDFEKENNLKKNSNVIVSY